MGYYIALDNSYAYDYHDVLFLVNTEGSILFHIKLGI
jgi:hypothetical protein